MVKKKYLQFLSFFMLALFIISFASAGLFDPSSEVAFHEDGKGGNYGYYEINDTNFWFFNNKPVKTIELIENDYSVYTAWNVKEIEVFKPTKLFDKTNYLDKDQREDRSNLISSEIHLFREWKTNTRIVPSFECLTYEDVVNGSSYSQVCTEEQDNSYAEEYGEWGEWMLYNFGAVQQGLYQTKTIVTRNRLGTGTIDWVDENEGYNLDAWATWWDTDWEFKRQLNVTETSGSSFTNYSTLVYVNYTEDTNSNANSNFSDLRFLDSTESIELDYYIQNKTDSSFAWVWVEVPSLTASSTSTIYMYYGNAGASSDSSIFDAFIYGNDGTVNDFTDDLGDSACTTNITDSSILLFCPESASYGSSGFNLPVTYTTGSYELGWNMKGDDAQRQSGGRPVSFGAADQTVPGNMYEGIVTSDMVHTWPSTELFSYWDSSSTTLTKAGFYNWNRIKHVVDIDSLSQSNGVDITIVNDTGQVSTVSGAGARGAMNDIGYLRAVALDDSVYLQNITFRQVASSEPTYVFGAEEESTGLLTTLITPANALQTTDTLVNFTFQSEPREVNLTNATLNIWNATDNALLVSNFTTLSGNESVNTTFQNNLTQGNYLWGAVTFGTIGTNDASENRTLTIHITSPTVNVSAPSGEIDFIPIGDNLTLIYNISETGQNLSEHLDQCWYVYNDTINALNCTGNTENFTYIPGYNNISVYANDTLGLTANDTSIWTLLFDYWTIDHITPQYESTQGIFVLNTSLIDGETIEQAIFSYNDTNYTTSIITSGGQYLITASILLPSVTSDTNFTLSFYVVVDGTTYNFLEETQEVLDIGFITCAGQDLLMNISLFDEGTKASILGDIELNIQVYSKTSDSVVAEINNTYENISYQEICLSPNASFPNLYLNSEIRYFKDEYATEFYYIQDADLTDYPINLSLFDLKLNDSTEFSVTYKNDAFIFIEGAIIQLQRKYVGEDSYEVVEAPITGDGGKAILHIDLNSNKYQASVVKDGELLDFFENTVFSCENELSGDCTYSFEGTVDPNNDVPIEDITDFTYSISIDETNQTVTVLFAVPSGTPSTINVLLEQIDMFGNLTSCNTTVITSAGSITCDYTDTIEKSILQLSISKNNIQLAVKSYINDPDLDMDGMNFFIVFLFMISLVGMAIASPEWMIIISVMVLIISGTLLLLKGMSLVMGLGALAWVVVAAAIIIMKMAKQEDR